MKRTLNNKDLPFDSVFPKLIGKCAYCHLPIMGKRKKWCSKACGYKAFVIVMAKRGNSAMLRKLALERDKGICKKCGGTDEWQADHIIELRHGGTHEMDNIQTLCIKCHKAKTKFNYRKPGKWK